MEIWKDIEGYPDYKVSNLGQVISYKRKVPHILKGNLGNNGYLLLQLCRDQKPPHGCGISRLVAKAFIPNPENKPQVNHKNSVRTDNEVKNLEWCTSLENISHARQMGNYPTKLTSKEVREIRVSKIPDKILAKKYRVSSRHIRGIKRREQRAHD